MMIPSPLAGNLPWLDAHPVVQAVLLLALAQFWPTLTLTSHDASTSPDGLRTPGEASANPVHVYGWNPHITRLGGSFASATSATPGPLLVPLNGHLRCLHQQVPLSLVIMEGF